ncbi:hypothetical protein [Sinorhizobium meliloti]|uniref:hypothetical protein n=1 Tax=Rhizobium meliloti TaxID=382 RepID=UPI001296B990|nr:hypothetical protein [Sinorhizobium meliloti]MQW55269.1 hypothetical protein [Sinorhizobium meliloti]
MLMIVLRYMWSVLRRAPATRRFIALVRLLRIKVRTAIERRPYLLIAVTTAAGLFLIFNPGYSPYVLSKTCGYIELGEGQLYGEDGDQLVLGDERPCEPRRVVAFQFFNLSNVDLEQKKFFIPAVSSGLFIKETARDVDIKNQWHEYTLFTEANNFLWTPPDPTKEIEVEQFSFNKGECRNEISHNKREIKTEFREGIILRSREYRSDPRQEYDTWMKCNYGAPKRLGFQECKYLALEFFVPVGTPKQGCPKRNAADVWFGVGTKKGILADKAAYEALNELAKDRWDTQLIKPVSEETYKRLSRGLPKICMRWLDLDGKEVGSWEEFATIAAVWCDL